MPRWLVSEHHVLPPAAPGQRTMYHVCYLSAVTSYFIFTHPLFGFAVVRLAQEATGDLWQVIITPNHLSEPISSSRQLPKKG